jgi:PAS domain S-box-containing protein
VVHHGRVVDAQARRRRIGLRYGLAVASAAAATGLALLLRDPLGEAPLPLFFTAVMLSAWYGGLWPGLLTTVLGGLAINYFFEDPPLEFAIVAPSTVLRMVLYSGAAGLISYLNARQRAARAEAEHLAAIIWSSEDAVIGVGPDGSVRSWNAGAERLYGYTAAEMVGQPISRLVSQAEQDVWPRVVAELQRGGRFGHFEATRVAKDGRSLDVSVAASPILDEDGRVVGASLVERDVTARRQAAEAAERLAAVVRSSSDAVVSKTLDGTITAWNPAAERLYGYAAHEAVGCSIEMLVPPEKRRELAGVLARVARGEAVEQLETTRIRRDGRRIRVLLSVLPIRGLGDSVTGMAAVARPLAEG